MPTRRVTQFDHGQRREALVASLVGDLFRGVYRAGQRLVAQELADRYGVSQTPIREALISLAGIGMVDLLPNRGAVVRQIGPHEIHEMTQVRRLLECEATRGACGRIRPEMLHELLTDIQTLRATPPSAKSVAMALEIDTRLHDSIAAACGNGLLAREIGRLKLLFRAFRDGSWDQVAKHDDYSRLPAEADEHERIVRALLTHDADTAATAMADHIAAGQTYWTRVRFSHTADALPTPSE